MAQAFRNLSGKSGMLHLLNRYETRFDRQIHRSLKLFKEWNQPDNSNCQTNPSPGSNTPAPEFEPPSAPEPSAPEPPSEPVSSDPAAFQPPTPAPTSVGSSTSEQDEWNQSDNSDCQTNPIANSNPPGTPTNSTPAAQPQAPPCREAAQSPCERSEAHAPRSEAKHAPPSDARHVPRSEAKHAPRSEAKSAPREQREANAPTPAPTLVGSPASKPLLSLDSSMKPASVLRVASAFLLVPLLAAAGLRAAVAINAAKPAPPPQPLPFEAGGRSPDGRTLSINSRYLSLDGKPWFPVMGEFHYSRYAPEDWETELRKMKAGGVSIVSTYGFLDPPRGSRRPFRLVRPPRPSPLRRTRRQGWTLYLGSHRSLGTTAKSAMAASPIGSSPSPNLARTTPSISNSSSDSTAKSPPNSTASPGRMAAPSPVFRSKTNTTIAAPAKAKTMS